MCKKNRERERKGCRQLKRPASVSVRIMSTTCGRRNQIKSSKQKGFLSRGLEMHLLLDSRFRFTAGARASGFQISVPNHFSLIVHDCRPETRVLCVRGRFGAWKARAAPRLPSGTSSNGCFLSWSLGCEEHPFHSCYHPELEVCQTAGGSADATDAPCRLRSEVTSV